MDTGGPWSCGGCGTPNADYRRRCLDCGAKRPDDPQPAPEGTVGSVGAGDIPLPLVARRPTPRFGRGPVIAFTVVVVALAIYGAVSYLGAERPTPADDRADLVAAIPSSDGEGGSPSSITTHCEATSAAGEVIADHATALVAGGSGGTDVTLIAFDTDRAANRFDAALGDPEACGFPASVSTVDGRAWVGVEGPDAEAVLDAILERLELEG